MEEVELGQRSSVETGPSGISFPGVALNAFSESLDQFGFSLL